MLSDRSFVIFLAVVVVVGMGTPQTGAAQSPSIRIAMEGLGLKTALSVVREQTALDLVYADRLVEGRTTNCTYVGENPEEALNCVLGRTGLEAQRVRRGQYVIVKSASSGGESTTRREALRGYVVDGETNERLPGAHVYLKDLEAGTTTNRDGYFVISNLPADAYGAQVSYVGYQTVDTTIATEGDPKRIALFRTAVESSEVLVRADSASDDEEVQVPGMTSVDLAHLDRLPSLTEPDLFRALQWTPGVRRTGAVSGGLTVRGGDPDQNLYLLDGAPVYHPWHAFSLISTFQTSTLKNTNLYRGAFPVEYGGRLSSVLDAQMKAGGRDKPTATAGLGVLSGRFRIEAPLSSKTSLMFSGRRSYIDKIIGRTHSVTDAQGRRDTLRTGYYFYDTSTKIGHRFNDEHRLTLTYYHGIDDLDLRLPFDLSLDFNSWLRPSNLFFEVAQNWENRVVSLQDQYLVNESVFLTITGYYSGYRAQEASFVQPTTTASLDSDYRVHLQDVGLKVRGSYHHSVAHEFSGGVTVSGLRFESSLESELLRTTSTTRRRQQESNIDALQLSGFVKDVWSPTPEWTFEPGLRANYFSGGEHVNLAPRLSVRYTVDPQWLVLRGSGGVHVQYLHRLRDRHSLAYDLVSSRWVPSSARVEPATGVQFGFEARTHPVSGLSVTLASYLRGTRNLLVPTDVFQQKDGIEGPGINVGALLGQYTKGEKRSAGLEFSTVYGHGPWIARLALGSGRTFVRAPGRVQSGLRWRPADLDVPLTARGALGWNSGPWTVTLAGEWRSGYPITAPVARYRVADPVERTPRSYLYRPKINNARLAPYFRSDLTLGYSFGFLSADWTALMTLYNATNRENELSRTYEPTQTGVEVDSQQGLPILPLLELEMRL